MIVHKTDNSKLRKQELYGTEQTYANFMASVVAIIWHTAKSFNFLDIRNEELWKIIFLQDSSPSKMEGQCGLREGRGN